MSALCSFGMLIARICLSIFFLWSGISQLLHLDVAVESIAHLGLPNDRWIMIAISIVELIGGLMLLFGFWSRFGALLLLIILVIMTIVYHDFWAEGIESHIQKMHFLKNLSIAGGLLYAMCCGAGGCSCDGKSCKAPE